MKNFFQISLLVVIAIALFVSIACAESRDFRISVIIPAIPGVNTPALADNELLNANTEIDQKTVDALTLADADFEKISNNDKVVIRKTLTDL